MRSLPDPQRHSIPLNRYGGTQSYTTTTIERNVNKQGAALVTDDGATLMLMSAAASGAWFNVNDGLYCSFPQPPTLSQL
ncbi:hypothetical protein OK016_27475 [Vibrio chagasii]|nr:hypothetical protein [Vibrio chagasii]